MVLSRVSGYSITPGCKDVLHIRRVPIYRSKSLVSVGRHEYQSKTCAGSALTFRMPSPACWSLTSFSGATTGILRLSNESLSRQPCRRLVVVNQQ